MARRPRYTVTVVNPTKKKKRKKKPMARRRKRRTTTRRRAPARRRRRRTRSNPSRARRYAGYATRRGGYLKGFGIINPMAPLHGILARMAGKVVAVWVVRKWGDKETSPTSVTTGKAWTFKNYIFALLSGWLGGELVGRFINPGIGQHFYTGAADLTATKLMWSEIFQRFDTTKSALGRGYMGQMEQLAAQAQEGDIMDDGQGNRWLLRGGRWVAMMGSDMGQMVEADYLGADLVEATPMGQMVEADYLGHLMPPGATMPPEAKEAQYIRRGSPDPYHSAFM